MDKALKNTLSHRYKSLALLRDHFRLQEAGQKKAKLEPDAAGGSK
jgi:hypothetical protein